MVNHHSDDDCIFCKIIAGKIPSFKIAETDYTYAFLDIQPLSKGHALLIPKHHGKTLLDVPEEYLADLLPLAKKVAKAVTEEEGTGKEFNVLQNNGPLAHQVVQHVHFHIIPKPNKAEGLGISWPCKDAEMDKLKAFAENVKARI
ncbi:HIT domain protein [Ascobolus immersus RN42]|uniref:HIT domain protein n=1 Tax=Ascobolus immersus RN42 TaxID=1160509 RepID=A0A3N4IK06_ASCIM|nr:HIT domain protein [Ascobolus immersus RN42]